MLDEKLGVTSSTVLFRQGHFIFDRFFTQTRVMAQCLKLAKSAAKSDLTVLITGESGTGKNLLAQAIHNFSPRSKGPFVIVNTSALNESLLESELFGHERGAFTGADKQRKGHFELANGGTLVLDEIGDMAPSVQPKILHAVEYHQFPRVGGESLIETDARIIAMTNHDLDELVRHSVFRKDLLFRLREFSIHIPPLRDRLDDLDLLCQTIHGEELRKTEKAPPAISKQAMQAMKSYDWPGNVRELRSVMRRAYLLCDEGDIQPEHLEFSEPAPKDEKVDVEFPCNMSLEEVEKRHIIRVLHSTKGNKAKTADILGIHRSTLDRKLEQYLQK